MYQLWVLLRTVTSFINMVTLPLKLSHNEQRAVIRFLWAKGLIANEIHSEMLNKLQIRQGWMATIVLQDQQYMFGVRSLLAAENALLIRNDLVGMLLRRPMPWLPQLMLSYSPTGAYKFQTLFGIPVFHEIQCTESSAIISNFGRCLLDGCQNS